MARQNKKKISKKKARSKSEMMKDGYKKPINTKYNKTYATKAKKVLIETMRVDKVIEELQIHEETYHRWKKEKPEFEKAVTDGLKKALEEKCKDVKEALAFGYSRMGAAGKIGIGERTLYEWAEKYPSFSQAIDEGIALSLAKLEERAIMLGTGEPIKLEPDENGEERFINPKMIHPGSLQFLLEAKNRKEYGKEIKINDERSTFEKIKEKMKSRGESN